MATKVSQVFITVSIKYEGSDVYLFHVDPGYVNTFVNGFKTIKKWDLMLYGFTQDGLCDYIKITTRQPDMDKSETIAKIKEIFGWSVEESEPNNIGNTDITFRWSSKSKVKPVPFDDPDRNVTVVGSYSLGYIAL